MKGYPQNALVWATVAICEWCLYGRGTYRRSLVRYRCREVGCLFEGRERPFEPLNAILTPPVDSGTPETNHE
jgi:hypothetical protein